MEDIKESYIAIPKPVPMSEARLALFSKHIPENALDSRLLTEEACKTYGVLWDTTSQHWVLPIREWNTFRLMGWQEKGFRNRYFKNRPTGIAKSKTMFNPISGHRVDYSMPRMIVVESPLDAVRLHSAGITGGVATFGTSVSPDQLDIMRKADELIFAFDNDAPGRTAALRMLDLSRKTGFECKFFNYGEMLHKDIGEMNDIQIAQGLETAKHCVLGKAAILGA